MIHNFKVGQKLWCVSSHRGYGAHEVEIESIGRKWATLAHNQGRMSLKSMWLDGGQYSSPGKCYLNKEAYEEEKAADVAWNDFRRMISNAYSRPSGATPVLIKRIIELLGL